MSRPTDYERPLPDTVVARTAATDPITYQAHGAMAVGSNELAAENELRSLYELSEDMRSSHAEWLTAQHGGPC
ncbi:hypothetical protein [Actinoallomurus sp. NPDC052274]|uniref:hypothetical protein n=1 Tax=Actinoallomurus sp. NPDC052274 TaxID=3155420 RepID=UPI00342F77B8